MALGQLLVSSHNHYEYQNIDQNTFIDQGTPVLGDSLNPNTEQGHLRLNFEEPLSSGLQQQSEIDVFLNSISTKPPSPVLTHRTRQIQCVQDNTPASKRQSTRLAQKAAANAGKGTIEIAHDLLVKKLGTLAGPDSANANDSSLPDGVNLYVQHFAHPLDKTTMGAIQDLIEQRGMIQMQDSQEGATAAPELAA